MKKSIFILFLIVSGNLFAQMPNTLSKSEKVYGLSKFWQEVNYNFIYLNKVDRKKWENDYKNLISEVQETNNDYDYYRLLQKLCATLKDGHTNVFFPNTIQKLLYTTHFGKYRIFMKNFNGKAIVIRTNLSTKDEIPPGTEVIKVNGLDTKEYLNQEIIPYIASSTNHILMDWAVQSMFKAPKGTIFDVTFKLPNGKIKELKLTHEETTEKEVYPEFKKNDLLEFKWIEKDIAYVALNSFVDPEIYSLFLEKLPELHKAKQLIIDLRKNGGGNSKFAMNIFNHLTNDTIVYKSRWKSRLNNSAYKSWGANYSKKDTINNQFAKQSYLAYHDELYYSAPYYPVINSIKTKKITIPTAILIGHSTASSAEDFLIYADKQQHMIKIGEPTFGSTGNPFWFKMPGDGNARVCAKKDTYPDGREFVGYGIQPQITIKRNLEDYLENKDPVLEKAIEYLNKK